MVNPKAATQLASPEASPQLDDGDCAFMIFAITLVMLQTPGMGLLQAGMIRQKNAVSILSQIFTGTAVGSVLWMGIGFSLTFGDSLGGLGILGNPFQHIFFRDVSFNTPYAPDG